jgi:pantetheine-phosphate adenylyltransferase
MRCNLSKIAVYPGSFDPLTLGHVNIIERGRTLFDRLIITVSNTIAKNSLFSTRERVEIVEETFKNNKKKIEVDFFEGLLIDYMHRRKADIILRGIRTVSDFEYEYQMALANKKLDPGIETVFMMTEGSYSYLSSTVIKEIFAFGGDVSDMVPKTVVSRLAKKERIKPI